METAKDERLSTTENTEDTLLRQGFGGQAEVEEETATVSPPAKKEVPPPFSTKVTLPDGTRVYRETLRIIAEAEAEAATIKPRRRVKRAPRKFHYP